MKFSEKDKHNLNKIHKLLRKARYHYYEMHESIMSDYDYDMLEKEYDEICDKMSIEHHKRVTNFVGFNIKIPMALFYNNLVIVK